MNKIKKLLAFIGVLAMCIALIPVYYAKADEQASISISSASGTVGSTITVTVTISASDVIDVASVPVSYDNSIIKPVGAGNTGVVSFALLDASAYGSNESISMQFEVIAAGTTTLSVAGDAKISVNGERATVSSASSGKVTAKAPASYSSDNTLKSLQISPGTLSPAFSPDRTTYNATVDADVTELVVSAAANDSAAKISISGRRMDPGSNTTTITVTAEDGSVKKYIIYTTRLEDGQEATTEAEYNTVAEPEITYVVLPITNSLEKPAGYALTRFTMNGKEVQVLMDADRQYCLFYGVSSLGEKGWFRYRVSDGSIQAYSVVKSDTANADVKADNGKTSGNSRFWLMIVLILGLIIAVFIVITIVLCSKLAKVKKVFNMASKDGVDLDEYTEKVIEGYESDEDDSYAELDTSTDTVSYGDDKSGKNDVEELKLFDVDDDK